MKVWYGSESGPPKNETRIYVYDLTKAQAGPVGRVGHSRPSGGLPMRVLGDFLFDSGLIYDLREDIPVLAGESGGIAIVTVDGTEALGISVDREAAMVVDISDPAHAIIVTCCR
ncbi:MAG: hypothetical protein IPP47_07545 [Bryobacterales bacterium]|nr:hypothetical protein [Bryobacterales bacterium]